MKFTHKNINEGMFYAELIPIELENKEYYYRMINDISSSLTSEIIVDFTHSSRLNFFIIESAQLLANSIRLFELGYFDAAYYSLRTSLEVFTVLFDLYDYDDSKITKNMDKFLKGDYFIKRKQIIDYLSEWGIVFNDAKEKMPNFFREMEDTSRKLNQRVHKSNLDNFYMIHKHKLQDENYREMYIDEYLNLLEKSIKIIAVMRLILDPIPLLMNNEDLAYRIPNVMTYSFSNDLFALIGAETLHEFEKTGKYIGFKEWALGFEKRNEYVDAVVMYEFIDLDNINEIFKQKELLTHHDLLNVKIASCSNKITQIISSNGVSRYRTSADDLNRNCNPLKNDEMKKLKKYFNLEYGGIYVSILNTDSAIDNRSNGELIYVFHNEEFTEDEIDKLKQVDLNDF